MKKIKVSTLFLASLLTSFHCNNATEVATTKSYLPSKKTMVIAALGVGVTAGVVYYIRGGNLWITPKTLEEFTQKVRKTIDTTFVDIRTYLETQNKDVVTTLDIQQGKINANNEVLENLQENINKSSNDINKFIDTITKDHKTMILDIQKCSSALDTGSQNIFRLKTLLDEQSSNLQTLQECKDTLQINEKIITMLQKSSKETKRIVDETVAYNLENAEKELVRTKITNKFPHLKRLNSEKN